MKTKNKLVAITMLLMLFVIVLPVMVENANASGALGGIWHLDEGTGTTAYDSSGNGNHGTVYGGAIWANGKIGKALEFDGVNDYVNVPDSNSLDITGKITLEAWIYPYTVTTTQVIVQKYNYSGPPYNGAYYLGVGGYGYNNKILFGLSHNGYNFYYILSNTNIAANTWTHVAATSNGTHMSIYINGVKDKVAAYPPGVIYASAAPLRIGCFLPELGVSRFFNGTIDEVRVAAGTIWTVDDDRVQCPNADFTSIQAAINKANPDDTIIVHDGIYSENLVVNKALTIKAASKPIIDGGATGDCISVGANNVVVNGFEIRNGYNGISGQTSGSTFSNNIIHDSLNIPGSAGVGILLWGDNDNNFITGNEIYNNDRQGIFIGYQDDSKISTGNVVESNVIYSNGLYRYANGPDASEYGVQLWTADNNIIVHNEIYDHDDWFPYGGTFDFAQGIYICDSDNNLVTHNNLHNNNYAVGLWHPSRPIVTNCINYNDIWGNTGYGVRTFDGPPLVDARFNWWGGASGPTHASNPGGTGDKISNNVDYSPWLGFVVGTSPMTWHVNPTGTPGAIQEAIDEASSGDTIIAHEGTYREALYINKSLTLKAASSPVIESPDTVPTRSLTGPSGTQRTCPVIFVYGDINVTIDGFTIDGRYLCSANQPNFIGIHYFEASGAIKNNVIKGFRNDPLTGHTGIGILVNHLWDQFYPHDVEISGNTIFDYSKNGITCNEPGTVAEVRNNIVTGSGLTGNIAQNGIQFGWNATGTIEENIVSGHKYTDVASWWSCGILLYLHDNGTTILHNNATDNNAGIYVYASSDVEVHYNNIFDNTEYGLYNEPSPIVNATYNWWGDTSGPYHPTLNPEGLGDNVSDDVDFIPWLPEVHDVAVIDVSVSPTTVVAGETVTIEVTVENQGSDYESFTVTVYYDDTPIDSQDVVDLLPNWNSTLTFYWDTAGMARGIYTIKAEASTVPDETDTLDNRLTDGSVEVLWHDVAVIDVVANRTWVYQGHSVSIDVTVMNQGDFPETVTITLYYNVTAGKIIGTKTVDLQPDNSTIITFIWNTTGVEYCPNYTVTAVATITPPDNDPGDNTLEDGKVKVRILGDIDGNGIVNMADIYRLILNFLVSEDEPTWDPDLNLIQDRIINMQDIYWAIKNFLYNCP